MAVFMGQNRRMQAFDWRTKGLTWRQQAKAQAYRILRGPVIRRAAERADLIVANTEETADILNLYIPATQHDGLTEKTLTIPLGYDPANFEFVPGRGERVRDELKLPAHAVVALLSSRFAPEKSDSIRLILRGFRDAARRDASLHLLAVGLDDGAVSRACRLEVAEHHSEGRVHLLPFASRTRLADLYSAADIAVFARPSISCQEALGTGAYGVFADDGSMDWLLTTAECGRTFRTGDEMDLSRVLCSAATVIQSHDRQSARAERAAHAARFNYDHIIDRVLGRLAGPAAD